MVCQVHTIQAQKLEHVQHCPKHAENFDIGARRVYLSLDVECALRGLTHAGHAGPQVGANVRWRERVVVDSAHKMAKRLCGTIERLIQARNAHAAACLGAACAHGLWRHPAAVS